MRLACWTCLGTLLLVPACTATHRQTAPQGDRQTSANRITCNRPVLDVLQEAAERELDAIGIAATIRRSEDRILEIDYKLREYQVHWWQKDFQWSQETRRETAPDMGGFRIELILQTGMYNGQLSRHGCDPGNPGLGHPYGCHAAYYDAYVSKIDMPPINQNIQVNIDCGLECDRQAVERIHRALLRACEECGWLATAR